MKKSRLIFEVQFEIGKIKKCIFSHAVTDTPSSEVFDTRKILVNLFKIIFFWAAFCVLLDLLKLDVRLRRSKKTSASTIIQCVSVQIQKKTEQLC